LKISEQNSCSTTELRWLPDAFIIRQVFMLRNKATMIFGGFILVLETTHFDFPSPYPIASLFSCGFERLFSGTLCLHTEYFSLARSRFRHSCFRRYGNKTFVGGFHYDDSS